jgi:hypothetical protein
MPAKDLWRKMLSMLFETGHPWITFKDACNVRSPQQHVGVVHSSNLCTEITLNTSDTEIAVCNLGQRQPGAAPEGRPDRPGQAEEDVATAMRMLDNVIDINYYAVKKARDSNLRHRPVGLGIMGFQDCLYQLRVPYASAEAVEFADRSMEAVCYHAYWASTELAAERGRYSSYRGSLWDRGILPQDSLDLLAEQRGGYVEVDRSAARLDWDALRAAHRRARHAQQQLRGHRAHGHHLQHHRRRRVDRAQLRQPVGQVQPVGRVHGRQRVPGARPQAPGPVGRRDGDGPEALRRLAAPIDRVPEELKRLYATAFEVDATWLVEAGARRQKWIDQAQSLNIYMAGASGKKLDETYKLAWLRGLKTTYYLRTTSATYAEKATVAHGALNAVSMSRPRLSMRSHARAPARANRQRHQVLFDRQPRLRGLPVSVMRMLGQCNTPSASVDARARTCAAATTERANVNKCLVFARNTRIIPPPQEARHMLVWEDEVKSQSNHAPRAAAARQRRARLAEPASGRAWSATATSLRCPTRPHSATPLRRRPIRAPRQRGRQAHHQRPDRRQPAGAVQVQVGLGEVPLHLRQPLDAARGQHVARHRDLEGPERPDRRRAPHHQAQPRLLRHGRFAGRQQHHAGHLPPHHGARVPAVPAAPGLRRGDPHPRLPVHRRERWAWTKARSSTPTTRCRRSATRTSS